MELTNQFIVIQGFKAYEKKDGTKTIFTKYNEETNELIFLIWYQDKKFHMIKFNEIDSDEAEMKTKLFLVSETIREKIFTESEFEEYIYAKGSMDNVITFIKLMVESKVIENNIALPENITEEYLNSTYNYNENSFEITSQFLIKALASNDEFENCQKIKSYYEKYKKEKNWNKEFHISE